MLERANSERQEQAYLFLKLLLHRQQETELDTVKSARQRTTNQPPSSGGYNFHQGKHT